MIKVLLVDDEKLERVLIRKGFDWEVNGFEIIGEASSAKEALEFVEHRRPELVVTDISMPQMDGLELSKRILQIMPECHIIIVTGYREFEYARKAIKIGVEDFLLKPVDMKDIATITEQIKAKIQKEKEQIQEVERLKKNVLASKDIVMESFFQRLVEARVEKEEAIHKLMAYNCEKLMQQCICVNIQIADQKSNCSEIIAYINQREYEETVCFVHYMQNIILYFIEKSEIEVMEEIRRLQQEFIQDCKPFHTIGISSQNYGFAGIATSYEESQKALSAAVLLGQNKIITYSEYEEILKQNPAEKEVDWDEFLFAIQNGLSEKMYAYLDEYIEQIKKSKVTDKEYLGLMCMNVLSKAGSTLHKYGIGMEQVVGEAAVYEEIRKITTVDEVTVYLKQNLCLIMEFHERKKTKQGNKVVKEALEYMERNMFDPDLSLRLVASKIYSNESYLSRVFKKEIGISLIEHITKKRIEESIQLLNSTDLKVYEIADKVGFRDPHYFSICFKKQTGVTIKEFKK